MRIKGARQRKGKGQEKNSERVRRKKNPNFGLCASAKLKYCTRIFLYLISGKSTFFGKKKRFFSKFDRAHSSVMAANSRING